MGAPVQAKEKGGVKTVSSYQENPIKQQRQIKNANLQGHSRKRGSAMRFRPRGAGRAGFAPRLQGPHPGMRPPPPPPPHAMGPPMMRPPMRGQRPMGPPGRMMGPRVPPMMGPPPPGMHPPHPMGMRHPPHMMGRPPMPPPPPMRGRGPMPFRPMPPNQKRKFMGNNNFQQLQAGKVMKKVVRKPSQRSPDMDLSKSFVTESIKKEFEKKEELLNAAKKSQRQEDWATYRQQRDKCWKIYHEAETEFIGQQEDDSKKVKESDDKNLECQTNNEQTKSQESSETTIVQTANSEVASA